MNFIESVYYTAYMIKKQRDFNRRKKLPKKVISVGNLTLGGTGKTPAVIALAGEALSRGLRPVILSRGYRGKAKNTLFVNSGTGFYSGPEEAGDEPVLIAERLCNVEIIKGKERYNAGTMSFCGDIFIIDDGFQHWRLHRDIDIVLVDVTRGLGNKRLFPMGILREPPVALKRADIVVKTKSNVSCNREVDDLLGQYVQEMETPFQIFDSEHRPSFLKDLNGKKHKLEIIKGKRVFAFSALGNNKSFELTLNGIGAKVVKAVGFRDHYKYNKRDIDRLVDESEVLQAEMIITTEKDLVKLRKYSMIEKNIFALSIDFQIDKSFYNTVFDGYPYGGI